MQKKRWMLLNLPTRPAKAGRGLMVHAKEQQRVLLGDGWVVEHGHSFNAQQHSQTPRNHVVEDNGAGGERDKS